MIDGNTRFMNLAVIIKRVDQSFWREKVAGRLIHCICSDDQELNCYASLDRADYAMRENVRNAINMSNVPI